MIKRSFKKVLVVLGGNSGEREVSLNSGRACIKALKKKKYIVSTFDPKFKNLNLINRQKVDVIFNALHGKGGEDGVAQTYFEYLRIPYTHSGVVSSFNAMNKIVSKELFIKNKILTPKFIEYSFDKTNLQIVKRIEKKLKFPVVIKPINEGSSVNVFICTKSTILKNLKLLKDYKKIIIEEFIPGREIQAAIINSKKLGAIELKPKRQFYDYQAKYNPKAKTKHIMPVNLKTKDYNKLMHIALKAHKLINCRGVSRSDFKFHKGKFYLLEINTQPGMTSLSLVPEIASYHGINFINLIKLILKDASTKK